ncbi:MAG: hypothetical protein EPO48_13115 [Nevskiaceae bacterium]|nr:MAG: hypothetical protein EPO48_13115 [Nevskiaceae bacterium]
MLAGSLAVILALLFPHPSLAATSPHPEPRNYTTTPASPSSQSPAEAEAKSAGCRSCHSDTDRLSMHANPAVVLGCTDCHGGNASIRPPTGSSRAELAYADALNAAHVLPLWPASWTSSANPQSSYTLLNRESPEFIRFVNPGDYRVADLACGACHQPLIEASRRSLMATAAMFWEGAAYNNGILPFKRSVTGESYAPANAPRAFPDETPLPLKSELLDRAFKAAGGPAPDPLLSHLPAAIHNPVPVDENMRRKGVIETLYPLPAWEVTPPADVFRVFERGGRNINSIFPETGLPNALGLIQRLEEPGRPDLKQSNRGPGTGNRIAVPLLNLHKTRLNDPLLWFLGTNDQPGDYRSSGCTACHVVYANDRDPRHSGPYAKFGHSGTSQSKDPTIPRNEPGHPLQHAFTRAIPTAQCMVCHMHQPNMFMNSMLGYTMWDYEADAPRMWPEQQRYPSDAEIRAINQRNPEEAATRGLWSDPDFLKGVWDKNPEMKDTQFADYHGHGWNFRAVYKRDKKGNLLDAKGGQVADDDPQKFKKAVHLSSIHVDKGMQCVDCHFSQDVHGTGHIQGEVAQAIEIECQDCHGTADRYPLLRTSGPAAPAGGSDLSLTRVQDGRRRFQWVKESCFASTARNDSERPAMDGRAGAHRGEMGLAKDGCENGERKRLIQRSSVTPGLEWEIHLVKDTVTPGHPRYNAKAARAKLMARDTQKFSWGTDVKEGERAHQDDELMCISCHSSWTTSCFGCHLPIQANWKSERQHFEGGESRNYATYNPQVARDDFFMLGKHGEVKGNRIAPVRSSSALVLSSTNSNRERIYIQQPPVSAGGYSSQAFAPHYPHTERTTETKTCSDCHLSEARDNNAWMASLLGLGTNFVNFVGFNAWAGSSAGIAAVQVTEWDEPQAVIGSYLHRYAYPDWYRAHQERGGKLGNAQRNGSGEPVRCLQLRGEYLYAAEGRKGLRAYDAASIANKGFSQKLISAPFSPLGQDIRVESADARCVALPTNQPIAPWRNATAQAREDNLEQPMHPIYHYALVADAVEGLILVDVDTLQDGEPRNNFLKRALTWNANGVLKGARHLAIAGSRVYLIADAGLVTLDLDQPLQPKLESVLPLEDGRGVAVQFRYAFVISARGLEVFDLSRPAQPVPVALLPLADARRVYLARTYAYIAAGAEGLVIADVQNPEQPRIEQRTTAEGRLRGANDVVIGTTNASLFAYVADVSGLQVLQLTAPDTQPKFYGFSPEPKPQWIATWPSEQPLLALSKGLDRDRAVDETGNQIAVFGRIGSRPFTRAEMERLFLDADGKPWFVSDEPEH